MKYEVFDFETIEVDSVLQPKLLSYTDKNKQFCISENA
jgi:hypothetical protein